MEVKYSSSIRVNIINEISSMLSRSTEMIENIAKSLDWDKELFASKEQVKSAQCPVNKNHVLETTHLNKHVVECTLRKLGVDIQKDRTQSSCFYYTSSSSVVPVLSSSSESDPILPTELLRYYKSPEERLQIYDHVVEVTKSKRKSDKQKGEADVGLTKEEPQGSEEQCKSKLEMLAEQRDYKRRRQSYRAKNVHITKRTPTDIMREIIENRMLELQSVHGENMSFLEQNERI